MPDLSGFGKLLIGAGVVLAVIGVLLIVLPKLTGSGGGLGRLPGDILIKRDNFTFYFPVTTGLIISAILSLPLYFFLRR